MANQAVESKNTSISPDQTSDKKPDSAKPTHLHLVDDKTDPNIRIGARLRAAREDKGLSIDEIARQMKFRREYLHAIESMQIAVLPKGFINPYVRAYASFLGLDPTKAVADFNEQCGALSQTEEDVPKIARSNAATARLIQLGIAASVALVLGLVGWFGYQELSRPEVSTEQMASGPAIVITPQVNGAALPVTQTASPMISAAANTMDLEIRAKKRAWIEVRGADGTLFVDRQFSAGDAYSLRVGAGWTLTTQNAGAFEWVKNGKSAAPLGEADQALYTLSIDAVAQELAKPASAVEEG